MSHHSIIWILALFCLPRAFVAAEGTPLSLDGYLSEVKRSNPGYTALQNEAESAYDVVKSKDLFFHPQLVSQLQYADNTLNTQSPLIYGTSNSQRSASVGIREKTPYGLGLQLDFDAVQSILYGTDPAFITRPNLTNLYIVPEASISLWQNFLGRSDRANAQVTEAQELAKAYGKGYESKALLVQAEGAYWKLAVERALLQVQTQSVDRANDILEFDTKKLKRHLIDPSDLLLAQAAVKGKELELKGMEQDEKSAEFEFNSLRADNADAVAESLSLPPTEELLKLELSRPKTHRGDVRAAEEQMLAESAGDELARQKLLPELTLYGSIFAVGLNFTLPLDIATTSSVRSGYAERMKAANLTYQRKLLDEESDWKKLERQFADAKDRLSIALDLEEIQKKKFENVRRRKLRGLTVEDQVFQYELDYLSASIARVQIEGLILGLRAEAKLYQGTP